MQRSYCGLIDLKSVEENLVIKGWVNTRRDHGGVIFIDLRDHTGLVQVVFNPEEREMFEAEGFSVVQDFCGHGIGQKFHLDPNVLHYGEKGTGEKIKEGMIFTIEPMINAGNYETKTLNDGWTAVSKDKSLSAQFEHTIGVTKNGYEIFTLSKENI